jgi:hypothetical protein
MLSAVLQPAGVLAATLDALPPRAAIGVNFLVPFLEDRAVVEVAAARVPLVDFFWGDPDPALVSLVHDGGALAAWQVGSVEEACAAADAGCDLVVAQGVEAGGHVRGRLGLLALLELVLEAVGRAGDRRRRPGDRALGRRRSWPRARRPRGSGRASSPPTRRSPKARIRTTSTRCCARAARTPC